MVVLKRKQMVLVALIVMVAIAGYLNTRFGKDEEILTTTASKTETLGEARYVAGTDVKSETFTNARLQRELARSQAVELLKGIMSDSNASVEAKADAEKSIAAIARYIQDESVIENLIIAKGYKDAVVYLDNGEANVTVKTNVLNPQDVVRIAEIITSKSGIDGNKIKIVEVHEN